MPETICELHTATVRAALPEPIVFGDWVMKRREFVLVRVRAESGLEGFAFTLTREGPVAAAIQQAIAYHYVGTTLASQADAAAVFYRCQGSNLGGLSGGMGLRGLSIVDLAVHDLLARSEGLSIARYLGGEPRSMPATAIIGYPPALHASGRRPRADPRAARGGLDALQDPDRAAPRIRPRPAAAAREAAGDDAWVGMDAAWIFRKVDDAVAFLDSVAAAKLGWFEDVFPPGDAGIVAEPARALGRHPDRDGRRARRQLLPRGAARSARPSTSSASTSPAWEASRAPAR